MRFRRMVAAATVGVLSAGAMSAVPLSAALAAEPSTVGLTAWYRLDETSGTVARDSSGNGHDGVVDGAATWNAGEGFRFSGGAASSGNAVKLPDDLIAGHESVTVALDVWVDPALTGNHFVYNLGNLAVGTPQSGTGYLFTTTTPYRATVSDAAWAREAGNVVSKGSNLAKGGWKHLAFTLSGATGTLYEDGVQVAQSTSMTITPDDIGGGVTTRNYLGRSAYAADGSFRGVVRNFRLYDRALPAAEVGDLARRVVTDGLAAAGAALDLGDTTAVVADLALPRTGAEGTTIAWASSDPAVVSPTGAVTRPESGSGSATVTLTATISKGLESVERTFTVTVAEADDDAAVAQSAAAALVVHNADDARGHLTLPTTGEHGATVTWTSSAPDVVADDGTVARPAPGEPAQTVTLTADVTVRSATATRTIEVDVPALPVPAEPEGYLFSYFLGEGTATGEQVYFGLSEGNDPLHYQDLNDNEPVLTSDLGEQGLRDPFIIRSPEGDKFYQIATDLRIHGGNGWDAAQRTGSRSIMVWESTDLVTWTDQRLVEVSPETAGNTWAPEAYYDQTIGAYVVFWASKLYAETDPDHTGSSYNRMMYATTRDFRTFTEPQVWIDPGYSVIDSTVTEHDGVYYRFTKDERNNTSSTPCSKFVTAERSTELRSTDYEFVTDCIGKANSLGAGISQGEGPTIFRSNTEEKWYMFIDEFGGRGYVPFETTDLDAPEWTMSTGYDMPSRPRHGTVLPVSKAEYDRLLRTYQPDAFVESAVDAQVVTAPGQAPALPATVEVHLADGSTGRQAVTWDAVDPSSYAVEGQFVVEGALAPGVDVRARAVVTVSADAPTDPEPTGPVLHYPLTGDGGTVATDLSGSGRDGAILGGATRGPDGLVLDGTNDHVRLPDDVMAGMDAISVSLDVKIDPTQATPYFVYGFGNTSGTVGDGYLFTTGNSYRTSIASGNWSTEQTTGRSGHNLDRGVWKHVTYTLADGVGILYEDGVEVARNTAVTITPGSIGGGVTTANYLGRSVYPGDRYLEGTVRDLRIHDRALSAAEVAGFAGPVASQGVEQDRAALDLGDTTAVTEDLGLPTSGAAGSTITWASSDPAVVSAAGTVTRPAAGSPSAPVTLTATITKGVGSATRSFDLTVLPALSDAEAAQRDAQGVVIPNLDDVRGNLTLPGSGANGSTLTWSSSAPAVVTATGEVERPAHGQPAITVDLTVTATRNGVRHDAVHTATVQPLPAPLDMAGYFFPYFKGESTTTSEELYFGLSQGDDPLSWQKLNDDESVLRSSLGEQGLRDPFIIRSHEGDRFFMLATDLNMHDLYGRTNFGEAQESGSTSLAIWESTDLVTWSEQRMVQVSSDLAGNTWAPEAFYDEEAGEYVVYWASNLYPTTDAATRDFRSSYNRMMFVTTRDFVTFSEPKPWVDVKRGTGRGMIDATIAKVDDTFYRFIKDEASMTIRQERSTDLTATVAGSLPTTTTTPWQLVKERIGVGQPNPWGGTFTNGEGPTTFQDNEDPSRWYMFIDQPSYHGGQGYMSFQTDDIATGDWTATSGAQLPVSPRHGTVLPVTQAEYDALLKAYQPDAFVESAEPVTVTVHAGHVPVLPGTVTVRLADGSTGERPVTWDEVDPATYDVPGEVVVEGTMGAGVSTPARAVVTVTAGDVATRTLPRATPASVVAGDPADLTVMVKPHGQRPDGALPTGRVELLVGGTVVGTADVVDGSSSLTIGTTGWQPGRHDLRVRYSGDATFAGSEESVRLDVRAAEDRSAAG